ncbi:MAG: NADH:ubiquinone oxidoreductase [Candidatus Atribacteria bacterium]|nr:MAG: NADH:ubiquinone oxidoreductase [Candidatus Atribacteria bacterium]
MTALTLHAPVLLIALPLLGAFATPLIGKLGRGARDTLIGLIVLAVAGLAALLAVSVFGAGGVPTVYELGGGVFTFPLSGGQVPIRILFEVDGMSAFMGLITALIVLTGAFFSFSYWKERSGGNLYFSLFLMLAAGVFGMVLTGDMFNFFVFLEITSIAAAGLVGFRVWLKQSQEAGFKVMAMYTLSGLFVLLAIGLLYGQYGHLNIATLAHSITGSLTDMVALGLLLTGLAMKAGAVPMHMWAPDAYGEAPAPMSAVLVANSQASLYGLFRVLFTLFGATVSGGTLGWILIVLALLTIFVGVTMALIQNDLKRLVAYGAVSQIGYMMLGVGVGLAVIATKPEYGLVAMQGGIFHMLNDAACVGLLFFASGAIIRAAGTLDLNRMGGLGHRMKWTSIFFAIGAVALAGVPPFNGFASKFLIYEASFKLSPFLAVIAVLSSILLLAVFVKAFQAAFLGPKSNAMDHVSDPSPGMMLPMAALVLVIIVFGLFPGFFVDHIVTPAAKALWLGRDAYINAVLGG